MKICRHLSTILLMTLITKFKEFSIWLKSKNFKVGSLWWEKILFWKSSMLNVWGDTLSNQNKSSFIRSSARFLGCLFCSKITIYINVKNSVIKKKIIWIWLAPLFKIVDTFTMLAREERIMTEGKGDWTEPERNEKVC